MATEAPLDCHHIRILQRLDLEQGVDEQPVTLARGNAAADV